MAGLAGVGHSWYTWFEQGRVRAAPEFLLRIAAVYGLKRDEIEYIFALAGYQAPEDPEWSDAVSDALRGFIDASWMPAWVLNRRWDRIAWNRAAEIVLGEFPADPLKANVVWRTFLCEELRDQILDWEDTARITVAQFYASTSLHLEEARIKSFIEYMCESSSDFAALWERRDVLALSKKTTTFIDKDRGGLRLNHTTFRVNDHYDQTLCVFTPDGAENEARLRKLVGDQPSSTSGQDDQAQPAARGRRRAR